MNYPEVFISSNFNLFESREDIPIFIDGKKIEITKEITNIIPNFINSGEYSKWRNKIIEEAEKENEKWKESRRIMREKCSYCKICDYRKVYEPELRKHKLICNNCNKEYYPRLQEDVDKLPYYDERIYGKG